MLSRTAEHALRAAIFLARQDEEQPTSADAVAKALGAPRNYLGKTLGSLVGKGIVSSSPGRNGGFRLAIPADELTVARIVDAVDPPRDEPMCLLGGRLCDDHCPCDAHKRWKAALDLSRASLESLTVAEIIGSQAAQSASNDLAEGEASQ